MKLTFLPRIAIPLSLAFVALASSQAQSAIVASTGSILVTNPPFGTSLIEGQTQSNKNIFAFAEQQAVTSYSPFTIDVSKISGTIQGSGVNGTVNLSPANVISGELSSYFLHFDPNRAKLDPKTPLTLGGTITFDQDIVGIITETESLDGSDFLGNPNVTYPTGAPLNDRRGLGWGLVDGDFGDEFITISPDKRTLNLSFTALKAIDQIRVITSTGGVVLETIPEPSALLGLLALGTIGAGSRLLSRKKP